MSLDHKTQSYIEDFEEYRERIPLKSHLKKQGITMDEYQKKMDKVIKKKRAVADTLIKMLEEARKFYIKQ